MNTAPNSRSKRKKKQNGLILRILAILCVGILLIVASILAFSYFSFNRNQPDIGNKVEKIETLETEQALPMEQVEKDRESVVEESLATVSDNRMEVLFLDVGQGDATLIKQGEHAILIDTGTDNEGAPPILKLLEEENITKLDYLVITHGHEDHMGAGANIIDEKKIVNDKIIDENKFQIDHVICDLSNEEGYVEYFNNMLLEHKINTITPEEGQIFNIGEITLSIVMGRNEEIQQSEEKITNVNNQSIAVMITHGDNKLLFYGDGEEEYEKYLLDSGKDIQAKVLKVAHHGSSTSSSDAILEKINPEFGVVSSAKQMENGFPGDDTLMRLGLHQITTFYTNRSGTIRMLSDGKKIKWSTQR